MNAQQAQITGWVIRMRDESGVTITRNASDVREARQYAADFDCTADLTVDDVSMTEAAWQAHEAKVMGLDS